MTVTVFVESSIASFSNHRPCLKSYRAPVTDHVWRVTGLQSQTVSGESQGLSSNPDFLPDLCYFNWSLWPVASIVIKVCVGGGRGVLSVLHHPLFLFFSHRCFLEIYRISRQVIVQLVYAVPLFFQLTPLNYLCSERLNTFCLLCRQVQSYLGVTCWLLLFPVWVPYPLLSQILSSKLRCQRYKTPSSFLGRCPPPLPLCSC